MQNGHGYYQFKSVDEEKRKLHVHVATLSRSLASQQDKNKKLDEENRKLRKEKNKQDKELERLKGEIEKTRKERDMYRKMLFKKNTKQIDLKGEQKANDTSDLTKIRGRSKGHKGAFRSLPSKTPDTVKRVFFTQCPDCHKELKRTDSIDSHTIEDIPEPQTTPVVVTRYDKERQWCTNCVKEVIATAPLEIPGSRFGINLIIYVLILKYGCKMSLSSIVLLLFETYSLQVSKGGLIQILHRARKYLGSRYDIIRDAVRASPVKHADETGWRVDGINAWVWDFLTTKEVYLTIEESRGGGIPKRELEGAHKEDVLVRDDYAAYKKLPLKQQSCWAHLLRKSRESAEDKSASAEAIGLHNSLKELFGILSTAIQQPFDQKERSVVYQKAWDTLSDIMAKDFRKQEDAKEVQTRIKNQGKNLLTALLHEGVPLTNNLAERSLRPLVVQRKMSGGSRSWEGAKTTAVNTSVYQTIQLQSLPLVPTLREYLLAGATGKR